MLACSPAIIYLLHILVSLGIILTMAVMQMTVVIGIPASDIHKEMLILPILVGVLGGIFLANLYLYYQQQIILSHKIFTDFDIEHRPSIVSREIEQALSRAAGLHSQRSRMLTYFFYILSSLVLVYGFASAQMIAALGLPLHELKVYMYLVPTLVGALFGYLIARNRILGQELFQNIRSIQQQEKKLEQEIIERRLIEETLRERGAALQAANDELDAFSHTVSHDLRSPLRSMCNFSQILLEDHGSSLDKTAENYLNRIISAGLRMNELLEGLTQLARLRHEEITFESVDLSQLAKEAFQELVDQDMERHVECEIADGIIMSGDRMLLRSVMANLIGNAWKYTTKTSRACIQVGVIDKNGMQVCYVRDNGVGFDPDQTENIFRPFYRLHDASEFSGSGIGLATVQRIIERHHGQIWAESNVDKGTVFYFSIGEHDLALSG